MTTSCPSQTNRLRQPGCLVLQLFDPEPRRIDFALNGMMGDERKTERARGGESERMAVNCVRGGVREKKSINSLKSDVLYMCEGLKGTRRVDV